MPEEAPGSINKIFKYDLAHDKTTHIGDSNIHGEFHFIKEHYIFAKTYSGIPQEIDLILYDFEKVEETLIIDNAIDYSIDGSRIVYIDENGTYHIIDLDTLETIGLNITTEYLWEEHQTNVLCLSLNGDFLIYSQTDGQYEYDYYLRDIKNNLTHLLGKGRNCYSLLTDDFAVIWDSSSRQFKTYYLDGDLVASIEGSGRMFSIWEEFAWVNNSGEYLNIYFSGVNGNNIRMITLPSQ